MLRFAFRKLIRDKILDQQLAEGSKPEYRVLDKNEHVNELIKKLAEEAREVSASTREEAASEIADLQQVLDDLTELLGIDPSEVRLEQARKNQKFGPFKKGIFVESVEVEANNTWVAYYRKHPDRYPEIM